LDSGAQKEEGNCKQSVYKKDGAEWILINSARWEGPDQYKNYTKTIWYEDGSFDVIKDSSYVRLKWRCKYCDDVKMSKIKRWHLDVCKCGRSSVDLEESYYRINGDIEILGWVETE